MADILAVYYSLTHQTETAVRRIVGALEHAKHHVTLRALEPIPPYTLPLPPSTSRSLLLGALRGRWPIVDLHPLELPDRDWDVLLIGYQPWFMTPSVPIHSLLKGPDGEIVRGRRVIGVITCRAMYKRAARLFEEWVGERGGEVVEQHVFVDQDYRPTNMLSLGYRLSHGHDPVGGPLKKLLKPFGIGEDGQRYAQALGERLARRLDRGPLYGNAEVIVHPGPAGGM